MEISQTTAEVPLNLSNPFRATLLESRQRWQGFGMIAADLLFETDLAGRLVFLAPDPALGWPAGALLGKKLTEVHSTSGEKIMSGGKGTPDPFCCDAPVKDRRVWMHDAAGRDVCMSLSSVPMLDRLGRRLGTRGVGVDVTERERQDVKAAAALRRGEVLNHILDRMRHESKAPCVMQSVLEEVMRALDGQGAAVLDLTPAPLDQAPAPPWPVLHHAGSDPLPILTEVLAILGEDDRATVDAVANGTMMLACPASTRFGERAGLVVWRAADRRAWDGDDRTLVASVAGVTRIVLEHAGIQRELAKQARTDPLTGLLNRPAFIDEAARRIDRLDREELPGTLLLVDLDELRPLIDRLGHDAGDAALVLVAELLRRTVRAADLVARLSADQFALWLDGSDALTAAERADGLRIGCPQALAHLAVEKGPPMTMSIGIACRRPGGGEALDSLMQRAGQALYEVKRAGRGNWRVSQADPGL